MTGHDDQDDADVVTTGPIPKMVVRALTITAELRVDGGDVHVIVVGPARGSRSVCGWRARVKLYDDEANAASDPVDAVEGVCHAVLEAVKAWDAVQY